MINSNAEKRYIITVFENEKSTYLGIHALIQICSHLESAAKVEHHNQRFDRSIDSDNECKPFCVVFVTADKIIRKAGDVDDAS